MKPEGTFENINQKAQGKAKGKKNQRFQFSGTMTLEEKESGWNVALMDLNFKR